MVFSSCTPIFFSIVHFNRKFIERNEFVNIYCKYYSNHFTYVKLRSEEIKRSELIPFVYFWFLCFSLTFYAFLPRSFMLTYYLDCFFFFLLLPRLHHSQTYCRYHDYAYNYDGFYFYESPTRVLNCLFNTINAHRYIIGNMPKKLKPIRLLQCVIKKIWTGKTENSTIKLWIKYHYPWH